MRNIFYTKGFSLVEIITVLVIISILTVMAMPFHERVTERMRASKAQEILLQVYAAQKRHFIDHNVYAGSIGDLDIESSLITGSGNARSFEDPVALAADPNDGTDDIVAAIDRAHLGKPKAYQLTISENRVYGCQKGAVELTPGDICTQLGF